MRQERTHRRHGRASNGSRTGLQRLAHDATKLAALRNALIEGESGAVTSFDIDKFIAQKSAQASRKQKD